MLTHQSTHPPHHRRTQTALPHWTRTPSTTTSNQCTLPHSPTQPPAAAAKAQQCGRSTSRSLERRAVGEEREGQRARVQSVHAWEGDAQVSVVLLCLLLRGLLAALSCSELSSITDCRHFVCSGSDGSIQVCQLLLTHSYFHPLK